MFIYCNYIDMFKKNDKKLFLKLKCNGNIKIKKMNKNRISATLDKA